MNFMGRVLNSVSDLYKDMHPGQMSGANDVIVCKTAKGFHSTGFHARFGNVQSFKTSREVILIVNDRVVNVEARLDREGNVFFSLHNQSHPGHPLVNVPFKSFKMFVESDDNYAFLLANYERVYECILHRQYVFSECIFKQVIPNKIEEVFNEHKIKTFLGNDMVVIGLYEETSPKIVFYMAFCLFSELYFCVERRRGHACDEETEGDGADQVNEKYTEKFLVKQLLRKRVRPEQSPDRRQREVYLPDHYIEKMHLLPGPNKTVYRLPEPQSFSHAISICGARQIKLLSQTLTEPSQKAILLGIYTVPWGRTGHTLGLLLCTTKLLRMATRSFICPPGQ
ncbi:hypothetical protein NERG_01497 [Nematocida ausubeli]|uniref:Lipin N-terminal domain-containing protein n=1 Tax=Nematocida ausubeli (strain ATCC PRA-371 / ERTm2) TaxID=1913371 RepID=H8ZCQ4_NEMA1|nr:hypothetical protein NERG_01497 [Nematocida ausubeli]